MGIHCNKKGEQFRIHIFFVQWANGDGDKCQFSQYTSIARVGISQLYLHDIYVIQLDVRSQLTIVRTDPKTFAIRF